MELLQLHLGSLTAELELGTFCGCRRSMLSIRTEQIAVTFGLSLPFLKYLSTMNLACIASVLVLLTTVKMPV